MSKDGYTETEISEADLAGLTMEQALAKVLKAVAGAAVSTIEAHYATHGDERPHLTKVSAAMDTFVRDHPSEDGNTILTELLEATAKAWLPLLAAGLVLVKEEERHSMYHRMTKETADRLEQMLDSMCGAALRLLTTREKVEKEKAKAANAGVDTIGEVMGNA